MEIAIGTRVDAIRALKGELLYVGEGAFRKVFVNSERTVVYKVCKDISRCESDCNREERECYHDMAGRGYKCIASTYSWVIGDHVVNAQPYYNGPRDENKVRELINMLRGFVFDIDFHDGGNIAFDDNGMPIVIDLQFFDPTGRNRMIERMVR